ncbi:MAG: hypothetical protein PVS3B3_20020 [Ktedonobacteraceae bacterium]
MPILHLLKNTKRTLASFFLALVLLTLACIVAACGSNAGSGTSTGGTGSSPANPSPTAVKGYGTAQGCPSDMVVSTAPSTANVVVKPNQTNTTVTAHVGDVVEIRLPFGQKWSGPTTSVGNLEIQQPSGYAWKTDNVCVWRFTAKSTGTTNLEFHGQALCKPGQLCPMYIAEFPFVITVK